MKLKQIATVAGVVAIALPANAQYEGTKVWERVGHGADSIQAMKNLSLFQDEIRSKNFKEAYAPWKELLAKAPFAQVGIYTNGAYMLAMLIDQSQDKAQKQTYFKELMEVYDARLKNLDGLNSFTKKAQQATPGDVMAYKAYYYALYGPTCDPAYSLDKSYNMFTDAIKLINANGAKEVRGYVLDTYFRVSYAKYQADNNGFREQFLQDYLDSREACEKMLNMAKQVSDTARAQKIVAEYDAPLNNIEGIFAQSKAADKEQIVAIFTPKVEANKDNLEYLKSALTLMAANDCDDTDVYYKAAEYAYNIEPTFESAIGTAQHYYKEGKTAESIQYYNKALELCKTDEKKGTIAMKIASAMAKSDNISTAYSYLEKAMGYNSDLTGKCYLLWANFLVKEHKFNDAIAYCNKAAAADISVSGTANRLKSSIQEVQQKNAEYEKANAAYKAEQAKRKKEEDFWKAGK